MSTALKLETYGAPEVALLLAASRGDPSSESVRRLMSGRLDWAQLTRLAAESHATVGLWEVVSTFPKLPVEAEALQSLAVIDDFRRYHIRAFVVRVSRELEREGIRVIALKGAALLVGGVSHPVSRTMSDIDLLVMEGSPEKAWDLCRSLGWTLGNEAWTAELYRNHHHLPPLLDPDGVAIGLELHRTLLPGLDHLDLELSAIVDRSRVVQVNDTPVRVPSVEDLLLHACLHFAWSNKLRHGAWRAFVDAHAILSDPSFDWDRFVAIVPSRRARQCAYWTLRLGRAVADLPVPENVLERLDPKQGGRFATILERHFATQLADVSTEASVAERVQRWLWFEALREPARSRESDIVWNLGALELPEVGGSARPARGPLRAGIKTVGYFARLVSRG